MSFNELSDAESERLALLSEELGEAVQVIGKILRHGYESRHPDGGPTNRESLEREMGDVLSALGIMYDHNDLDDYLVNSRAQQKSVSVAKYLHHNPVKKASSW